MLREALALSVILAAAGCQTTSPGTWKVAPGQPETRVSVAVMTLADDGTFTAQAKYGGRSEVMSGFYEFADGQLVFDAGGERRSYDAVQKGNELTISHDGNAVKMMRMTR